MPDILVRNIDEETLARLKKQAEQAGRSLQSETKAILEAAARPTIEEMLAEADAWRKRLGPRGTDSVAAIRGDRER